MKITITIEVDEKGVSATVTPSPAPLPPDAKKLVPADEPAQLKVLPPPADVPVPDPVPEPAEEEPKKKRLTAEEKEAAKAKIKELNEQGLLDSTIAVKLDMPKHTVTYLRAQMGLKGNGVFGQPHAKKKDDDDEDEEETDEAAADEPETEEELEELTYKCINPACSKYDDTFSSKNRIPNVMCHDCGEKQVVQAL